MITPEQREARKSVIGSSDVPALCGVDPYRSLSDLWLDKTGQLEDRPASEDCERGNGLEPVVLNWFERRMGVTLERNIELRDGGIFGANLDAVIPDYEATIKEWRRKAIAVVEAKTTVDDEAWGEPPDGVPLKVLVQVQAQMMVADCQIAYVPVLMPKYKRFHFEVYQIQRHDAMIAEIKARGEWFWERHVLADIPPPDVMPHMEALKRIRREPASMVNLNEDAAMQFDLLTQYKAQKKQLEQLIEVAQTEIITALGNAEAGEFANGERLTYLEQNGPYSCDWQLLEMRLRECGQEALYNELVRQSRFRVLRHKKAPK
jgi:putative phage-type endonuclease